MSITESSTALPPVTSLPNVGAFNPQSNTEGKTGSTSEDERNPVFTSLVTGDADVVGLVAYSVYKQNKHDWLLAFVKAKGREPDDSEVTAYIIGESTPRRLAIYRHLAQATLEGKGPDVQMDAGKSGSSRHLLTPSRQGSRAASESLWGRALGYLVTAVVVAAAVLLAIRFGLVPSPR
jgi:hypothetical protein